MSEEFVNPITLSFKLLGSYRSLLKDALAKNNIPLEDIQIILDTIEIDRGLYFSLNRKYQTSEFSFGQSCKNFGMNEQILPRCFPGISRLFTHQENAIRSIISGKTTVLSTGTGSGKTEAFLVPIIDHCLKNQGEGVKALIIYPMNALANDQLRRLAKAIESTGISFGVFVGSTPDNAEKEKIESLGKNQSVYRVDIRRHPPDILITNYVMLDWMLTRPWDSDIFTRSKQSLKYVVIDEIHSYRGSKATHLKFLLARLKSVIEVDAVYIATSATLRRGLSGEGYLKTDTRKQVDAFIKPLLVVDEYQLIEPAFEEIAQLSPLPIPEQVYHAQDQLDWSMTPDTAEGLRLLGLLTDHRFMSFDLDDDGLPRIKNLLKRNIFIDQIKHALYKGSQSFSDLVRMMAKCVPSNQDLHSPENVVKAYLSAISFLNNAEKNNDQQIDIEPVMDFRIHLFLRNVTGNLKYCIKCRSYHSGGQEFCKECGFPLFLVYKNDIHKCIGKVSGNKLKWYLEQESDDRKNSYYVLIDVFNQDQSEGLSFDHEMEIGSGELTLNYDPYGELRLKVLTDVTKQDVLNRGIKLQESYKDYEYLYRLVKSILLTLPGNEKKVLGFVDNREKATHYSMVIGHSFAHDFFFEFLKYFYVSERQLDLLATLQHLENSYHRLESLSDIECEIFKELRFWYYVFVKTPVRKKKIDDFLILKSPKRFTPNEREILNIFIQERAIQMVYPDDYQGKFIRFQTYYATTAKGIHIDAGNQSDQKSYQSISLGEDAFVYRAVVNKLGADVIKGIITDLLSKNVLTRSKTKDGKTHYYLLPDQITFEIPASEFRSYRELKETLFLIAGVHSSEIKAQDRKLIESQFQNNELNFLLATPTLEMGIDIGQLQTVLMVGIPPMPSNYAQRAGRAGRGHKNHFALITSFCFEDSNHDSYYFRYPKWMIDGVISPPTFDPNNIEILSKHFNAYLLSGIPLTRDRLSKISRNVDNKFINKLASTQNVFGFDPLKFSYFKNQFYEGLSSELNYSDQRHYQQQFYVNGFFPDYGFRKDQVYIVPEGVIDKYRRSRSELDPRLEDIAISEREPEYAYYKFSPGDIVFMAGNVYEITSKGKYKQISWGENQTARSYEYFEASEMDGYVSRMKSRIKKRTLQQFQSEEKIDEQSDVVEILYSRNTKIQFINEGIKEHDQVLTYSENREDFSLIYELERQALILRFDHYVCSKETYYLSLISALDRTIKDSYGLDEGEIKVLIGAQAIGEQNLNGHYTYVLLYDAAGWGNIPLSQICEEFDIILDKAYQKMVSCTGSDENGCNDGCYACLKSYGLHYFAHLVDKEIAMMFIGYLLGKNSFFPSISPIASGQQDFDLIFELRLKDQKIDLRSNNDTYIANIESSQNKAIFNLLVRAIQSEFKEGMAGLLIRTPQSYIVNAINKGEIKTDKQSFALLQFNLLRFKHYIAEKI